MFEFEREDDAREDDLDFLAELRTANLARLKLVRSNLSYGGPRWMRVAVERAIAQAARRAPSRPSWTLPPSMLGDPLLKLSG